MAEKPIHFTRHARNRMRRDKIFEGLVEVCVRAPDSVSAAVGGRINHWRREGTGYLRVTIAEESDQIVVVTVTLKRKGPD